MALNFHKLQDITLRMALSLAVVLFVSACASNQVVRPCIDDSSIPCTGEVIEQSLLISADVDVDVDVGDNSEQALNSNNNITGSGAQTPPLSNNTMSLAQVAAYTIANNPAIGVIRSQTHIAQASIDLVKVGFAPKLRFSSALGPESTYNFDSTIQTDQQRTEGSLAATQLLFDFGKVDADIDWATAVHESTIWRQQAQTDKILLEMVEAYLAVLELSLQINNSLVNEQAHEEMYRIIKLNADAGNATDADVERIVVGLEGAKTLTINLRSERQNSASNFKRLTGLEPSTLAVPGEISPAASRLSVMDIEGYAAKNPKMLSFEWDIVSLEAQQLSLERDHMPEISLNASAKLQQNVSGENPLNANGRVTLSISGQLYDGGEREAKNNQLLGQIDEVKYRYRQALDQLEQDLEDSMRILQTANEKRTSIAERIRASQAVVKLYQQQFEAGTRTIFELLDAQKELFAAKGEQITSKFEVLRATYQAIKLNGSLAQVVVGIQPRSAFN